MSNAVQDSHSSATGNGVGSVDELRVPAVPSRASADQSGNSAESSHHQNHLSALAAAIIKTFEQPEFTSVLAKLLEKGGPTGAQRLWRASQEILEEGPTKRRDIAWIIASEVAKSSGLGPSPLAAQPSHEVVECFLRCVVREPFTLLKFFKRHFSIEPLGIVVSPDVLREAPLGFLWSYIQTKYPEHAADPSQHAALGTLLRAVALRHDLAGLETCRFIRDRYEMIRGWIGQEQEAQFLWQIRDELTREICKSPLACERNLKLTELFPSDVPHPCLNHDAQRMLSCERWILDYPGVTERIEKWRRSLKIFRESGFDLIMSTAFLPVRHPLGEPVRGVQPGQSKFDVDACILMPLYDFIGIARPGAHTSSPTAEQAPRTWLSTADKTRYQQSRVLAACEVLCKTYWGIDMPDRAREKGRDLLRSLVREVPFAMALAAPALRASGEAFARDLSRIVREEALSAVEGWRDSADTRRRLRESFVVTDGLGLDVVECSAAAMQELEESLGRARGSDLKEDEYTAFLAASRTTCLTTPALEYRATALIQAHPDTFGASILARQLFEYRVPDPALRRWIYSQAMRANHRTNTWLNYAHAAVGLDLSDNEQDALRGVFEQRYEASVENISRCNLRARSSYRLIVGALYPDSLGEIRPLRQGTDVLIHSPLEQRVINRLQRTPGMKVLRDRFIPWAPAFDGVAVSDRAPHRPIVILVDGESYHSVNGSWAFRGFDGHSLLVSRILTQAGYPVVRIAAQFGEPGLEGALSEAISAVAQYVCDGETPSAQRLVVNPPATFTDIAGRVILYTPRKGATIRSSAALQSLESSTGDEVA